MPRHPRGTVGLIGVAVAIVVVAAGCGGSTATSAPPASAAPSAAPSVAPSAAASSAAIPEATETFTAANGRTIAYPAGWTTREDLGIVYFSTSAAASDRLVMSQTLQPGEVFVQFSENSTSSSADPATHLPDYLSLLLEGQGLTAGPVTTFTSAGRPAARLDASNDKLEMLAVSVKASDDLFADVIAYMAPGELATYEPLVLSMVDSLTYP